MLLICHLSVVQNVGKLMHCVSMYLIIIRMEHNELDFYSASSLKQQSTNRHVAPLGHIILIPSQSVFALNPACLVEKQEIPIS